MTSVLILSEKDMLHYSKQDEIGKNISAGFIEYARTKYLLSDFNVIASNTKEFRNLRKGITKGEVWRIIFWENKILIEEEEEYYLTIYAAQDRDVLIDVVNRELCGSVDLLKVAEEVQLYRMSEILELHFKLTDSDM